MGMKSFGILFIQHLSLQGIHISSHCLLILSFICLPILLTTCLNVGHVPRGINVILFFILIEINTVTSGLTILLLQVVPFQEISELSNHLLEETVLPVWFLYHAEWMTSLDLLPRLILLPEILRKQNKITYITSVSFCMGLFLKQMQKTTQK